MVNFYTNSSTNTFSVYPETGSQETAFRLRLIQDLDLSETELIVPRINSANSAVTDLIVAQVTSSAALPQYTGQYTLELYTPGTPGEPRIWSLTTTTFGSTTETWGATPELSGSLLIDTDRAYVFGPDSPDFTKYTTTNESGSYTTYHG